MIFSLDGILMIQQQVPKGQKANIKKGVKATCIGNFQNRGENEMGVQAVYCCRKAMELCKAQNSKDNKTVRRRAPISA